MLPLFVLMTTTGPSAAAAGAFGAAAFSGPFEHPVTGVPARNTAAASTATPVEARQKRAKTGRATKREDIRQLLTEGCIEADRLASGNTRFAPASGERMHNMATTVAK